MCRGPPVLTRPFYTGWRGNAKGTMVEGVGTEGPEILRGDRQGLKPEYELGALRGAEAPLFHFRADLPSPRSYTGELLGLQPLTVPAENL